MIIGNRRLDPDNMAYLMGILNVTPDSFSDGGRYNSYDKAMTRAEDMILAGADIIDVGGESTRPDYTIISDEEEINRVVPIIEGIKKNFDILIAVDTYKSLVAEASIVAGADMINDIWGLKYNNTMADVIAKYDAACCIMHNKVTPAYNEFVQEVHDELNESLLLAKKAGIDSNKICIDPGIGFGKTYEMNLQMLNHLESLKDLGYPILLGTSRKSVIGLTLNAAVDDRLEGTIATTVLGYMKGCRIFRVHDVSENKRVLKMTEAIYKS